MVETPTAKMSLSLILASLFSAMPFGVSVENIAIGMFFAIVGVVCKGLVDMAISVEKGDQVKTGRSLALMGIGCGLAPFVSTIYMILLTLVHAQVDATSALVLVVLGYSGPKAVSGLMGLAGNFMPSFVKGIFSAKD